MRKFRGMDNEFLLKNQPEHRKDFYEKNPDIFDLSKKYNDELFKANGCDPNQMGLRLLPKYQENYKRKLAGKSLLKFTKDETTFIENRLPKEFYLDLATRLCEDKEYLEKDTAVFVQEMNQVEDSEGWMNARLGILENGYRKACVITPSGINPVTGGEPHYGGESVVAQKRKRQGLPFTGKVNEIDPYIAKRGHAFEEFIYPFAADAIEYHIDKLVDLYPEPEVMFEHCIFGDYLQGNMDGVVYNTETGEMEGLEIKSTGAFTDNRKLYQDGLIPENYLAQCQGYMAIRGFNAINLLAGWGIDYMSQCAVIPVNRSMKDEAKMLGTLLWFAIEIVIKDGEIDDNDKSLNPKILLEDLYSIYGQTKEKTKKEVDDDSLFKDAVRYGSIDKEIKEMKARHKDELKVLENEKALIEAKLLEEAEDNEALYVNSTSRDESKYFFFKDKQSKRFSSKLFDKALKELKSGAIDDDEFNEIVRDRGNFVNVSQKRTMSEWVPKNKN